MVPFPEWPGPKCCRFPSSSSRPQGHSGSRRQLVLGKEPQGSEAMEVHEGSRSQEGSHVASERQ